MISKEQLQDLYKQGVITFTDAQLRTMQLPAATKTWLQETGLPISQKDIALGIYLQGDLKAIPVNGKTYRQIGYEWENVHAIALEEGTGAVYSINEQEKTPPVFINADLPAFLTFLQYYQQYQQRKSATDTPVASYSRDEMMKRLQEMKNRTAAIPPPPKKEKFDQKKEFRSMKEFFKQHDAVALKDGNWWDMILEQVEDDLL
ncbi:MAG TPA: SUKH-4 family immunity protein [Chitinophaga sp.]|uniref:SUKH-4 family immunity protein n=1 Tax=Chitinophaga sp. TaxID=1869181 RepID=UPI002F92F51B